MTFVKAAALFALAGVGCGAAQAADPVAEAFGARPGVEQASLSPDGSKVAFIVPTRGQGSTLFTVGTEEGATPRPALAVSGAPDRLAKCSWISNDRLVCTFWGMVKSPDLSRPLSYSRLIAVDAGGGNQQMLTAQDVNQRSATFYGGAVLDWLPGTDGQVLLARQHQRTDQSGTNIGSREQGLSVDRVDSRTLRSTTIEQPRADAIKYITDGLGTVRIAGFARYAGQTFQSTGVYGYRYRTQGSRDWQTLGDYDSVNREGFNPYAVDPDKNIAYGFRKLNGRLALYTHALDGSNTETLVLARPDVDVDDLVRIGRKRRIVGASYATDSREVIYFDPALKALRTALGKALPNAPIVDIVDASEDESKLLLIASSDNDPGIYYVFDKTTKRLQRILEVRPQLAGRTLATVRPITLKASDGTAIPAYLTLPPGSSGKGLPAIVMPHGGPAARDEWGFDWLPQYFAAKGYAVLQPNFRGSEGFGDDFQMENGFKSWRIAIGDVVDSGRWLVAEGIADPKRLGIVGWSYGGYAALQSAVIAPDLYKAVVAIAPVTDFGVWREEFRNWSNHRATADYVGPVMAEASPAQNAAKIKVPVLLVHGTLDSNVGYGESTLMKGKLEASGAKPVLITFPELDHQLEDGAARAQLLEQSDAHLRKAFGM
ncbi:S9 family peptidase [Sphingomonas sp. AP4-R1]|uniref:alpha/beta hydrolase family protein n=1 Tax=Sphingomonas sp. AP4-R1 TaxID=2735134 RepID=UPI0014933F31|nr:S9 family peptidase [Sphingomonas sp. AP4-R1]QJU57952.1 S9 family peptidase [Sphingomonas sp. AP4-R1]